MVYCVEFRGAFSTAARRDAVLADIQGRIAGRGRRQADEVVAARSLVDEAIGWTNGLAFSLRFVAPGDQADVAARVQEFATGARAPLAGSRLTVHDCSHDEDPPRPCGPVVVREW